MREKSKTVIQPVQVEHPLVSLPAAIVVHHLRCGVTPGIPGDQGGGSITLLPQLSTR